MRFERLLRPIESLPVKKVTANPTIIDNKEKLVRVGHTHPRIFIKPIYFLQNIPDSLKDIYIREKAYKQIIRALQSLPEKYSFILYDGYRPLQVQQYLFHQYFNKIQQQYPHLQDDEVMNETLKYVAIPSADNRRCSAPHLTGGAIDLTLGDQKGNRLNMGTDFDFMHESSATRYFEYHSKNEEVRKNRRILYNSMIAVGFTNYAEEWWHYDYGNVTWAKRVEAKQAQYGAIVATVSKNSIKEYRYV